MDFNIEKLKEQAEKRLARGGVIATGIGAFAFIIRFDEGKIKILLRRRKETASITGQDLSGRWELPGGGMRLEDLVSGQEGYLGSIKRTIQREVKEEAGVDLSSWQFVGVIYPAILAKEDLFDFAFSVPIGWQNHMATSKYGELLNKQEIKWIPTNRLDEIDIISPRMRFLIQQGLEA